MIDIILFGLQTQGLLVLGELDSGAVGVATIGYGPALRRLGEAAQAPASGPGIGTPQMALPARFEAKVKRRTPTAYRDASASLCVCAPARTPEFFPLVFGGT